MLFPADPTTLVNYRKASARPAPRAILRKRVCWSTSWS